MKKIVAAVILAISTSTVAAFAATVELELGENVLLRISTDISPVPAIVTSVLSTDVCTQLVSFAYTKGKIAGMSAGSVCFSR